MRFLRIWAIVLALSLIIGEAYRSWGAGRPVMFWMDDMMMGAMLIAAAILVRTDTLRRRAFFAAAWGVNAGMLYPSFFGKLLTPEKANPGNFDLALLTVLVGLAFVSALIGMVLAILAPRNNTAEAG
ncbi:hypothetical protein [Hyphomonas sp.]|uniref:hypothetical protein n=1 Tax=Hyphomonas sp. TaxID=87 RepID=UPI0032EEDFCF